MTEQRPHIIVISGPNGSGKSTTAPSLLKGTLGVNVPEDTIRRRYNKGMNNFFDLYMPLADTWFFYDNSVAGSPRLIASADQEGDISIDDELIWNQIKEESHEG